MTKTTDSKHRFRTYPILTKEFIPDGPYQLWVSDITYPEEADGLIHNSDRGIQYCSTQYVSALQERGIQISMTENGDPLENAIAERVNGILKEEWLNCMTYSGIKDARAKVSEVVTLYNTKRKHSSIAMLTPKQAHLKTDGLARCWRSYYKKEANRKDAYV